VAGLSCILPSVFRVTNNPVLAPFAQCTRRSLLHFTVFKQTACNLANEASIEQVFSRARLLADPDLLPAHLSTINIVSVNKNAFKPLLAAIKDKYHEVFRNKKGKGPANAEQGVACPRS